MNKKDLTSEDQHYGKTVNVGKRVADLLSQKRMGIEEFAIKMGRKGYTSGDYMLRQDDWKLSDISKACEVLSVSITDLIPMPTHDMQGITEEQAGPYGQIAFLQEQLESCKRESLLKDELINILKNK